MRRKKSVIMNSLTTKPYQVHGSAKINATISCMNHNESLHFHPLQVQRTQTLDSAQNPNSHAHEWQISNRKWASRFGFGCPLSSLSIHFHSGPSPEAICVGFSLHLSGPLLEAGLGRTRTSTYNVRTSRAYEERDLAILLHISDKCR